MDELSILGSLDQPLDVDHTDYLARIEEIVKESIKRRDATIALNACRILVQANKISSLTLAKGLFMLRENWHEYAIEESFDDLAYIYIGLSKSTVDNYSAAWSMFANDIVPTEIKESLMQRNIKDLIPIANTIKEGHEISDKEWKQLADAPDFSTVSEKIREIKGVPPRLGSLQIYLGDDGTLYAYQNNKRSHVGALEVDSDDEATLHAINRIVKNTGIIRK